MYRRLVFLATLLTFAVVVFGAYVRLSDAGLGCPDWPGCYGQLTPLHAQAQILDAHAAAPQGPVSMAKAWKEMAHRYLAGSLGLLIIFIAVLAWRQRRVLGQSPWLATLLVAVVVLQGLFGKWTVTLLLKPAIVTGHLIGGMTLLALLSWLAARQRSGPPLAVSPRLKAAALLGLALLACQVVLGGWVSTNYAALACSDLPTCQGRWLPPMDFANAFHLVRELGMTAEGAALPLPALTAIHWMHRLGAVAVASYLLVLALALGRVPGLGAWAAALAAAVLLQFSLGLANVAFGLALSLAAAHNAGAALLVVLLVMLNFRTRSIRSAALSTRIAHEGASA